MSARAARTAGGSPVASNRRPVPNLQAFPTADGPPPAHGVEALASCPPRNVDLADVVRQVVTAVLGARDLRGRTSAPLLWTLAEAAAGTGIHPRTLKRMVALDALPEGAVVRLPGFRKRMFSRAVLEEWISRGCPEQPRRARAK